MAFASTDTRHSLRAPARRRRMLLALAVSLLASWVAVAAVVSMHPPSGGGELRIPVMLYGDSDESVSGLQFDLAYDPAQFELVGITAGDAATGAGKEVILSETMPGQGRVLITGFNNNGMTDGQVATLTLRPLNSSAQQHDISLGQVLASDPDGNSIPIDYADLFQYPPAPPIEEEEGAVAEEPDAEAGDDAVDDAPEVETAETPDEPNVDESDTETNVGGTRASSGGFGGGFADAGGDRLGSNDDPRNARASTTAPRQTRNGLDSGRAGRSSGLHVNAGRGGDREYSTSRDVRSDSRPATNAGTPHTRDGARLRQSGAPEAGGATVSRPQDSDDPTEMALLRPARGLVDPPTSGAAAYILAMNPEEIKHPESGTRTIIAVLTLLLTLALLALSNLLFGRMSRPRWRKTR